MVADQRTVDRAQRREADDKQIESDLRWRLWSAQLTLWWEETWRLAWPLPGLVATFVALALFDLLPLLPGLLHAGLLAFFVAAGLVIVWRLRDLSWPSITDARRRLERDSGLAHRPLQTLADELAGGAGDPVAQALWRTEHRRLRALLPRVSLNRPMTPGGSASLPCCCWPSP
jgi:hypothetical protein